jgi:hypothetical protein
MLLWAFALQFAADMTKTWRLCALILITSCTAAPAGPTGMTSTRTTTGHERVGSTTVPMATRPSILAPGSDDLELVSGRLVSYVRRPPRSDGRVLGTNIYGQSRAR